MDATSPALPALPIPLPQWDALLNDFQRTAHSMLADQRQRRAATGERAARPETGAGAGLEATLAHFEQHWQAQFNGSAGPRYFGFVTGGATPAALLGDWITSLLDQNAMGTADSVAPDLELEALRLFRHIVGLPDAYTGSFVTGATMSNFVGLVLARQWVGKQRGINIASEGLAALGHIPVFSATAHSSIYKGLAMAGMGRNCLQLIPTLPQREAIDVSKLEAALAAQTGPCIVVANAGTVNTVDFDDLAAIAALKQRYSFWLHVDAAFGAFAACSPQHQHLVAGLDSADSITIDAHKWLNVPYDSAVQFTRHLSLQSEIFQNAASYLPQEVSASNFVHLTPENSRRLRALSAWFTMHAYGRETYTRLVQHHCELAQTLSGWIDGSELFERLAETRLNGLCFTLKTPAGLATTDEINQFLAALSRDGRAFTTATNYKNQPAVRMNICNWQTSLADIEIAWQAMQENHLFRN